MKKAQTVTDSMGNIYIVPGQMTKEEAEVYFPSQPERSKREDSIVSKIKSDVDSKRMKPLFDAFEMRCSEHCGNTMREVQ